MKVQMVTVRIIQHNMKATAIAHPNIAFTKYWGNKDNGKNIPFHNSISMNLSDCWTKTTVEFSKEYSADIVFVDYDFVRNNGDAKNPYRILDDVRKIANFDYKAKVVSENNFPKGAGIASSASGAAALALAASKAAGIEMKEVDLSRLARLFSGSGSRSVPEGFVEWEAGYSDETSYAKSIADASHWELLDIVAIVAANEKKVGSSLGHGLAQTSPLFNSRLVGMENKNNLVRKAILEKDLKTLGEICEEDCLSMHAVMITSKPSLRYWTEGTLKLMDAVESWRHENIEAYFTIDAGPNVHILTLPEYKNSVIDKLDSLVNKKYVKNYIINKAGGPAKLTDEHLF